jgi:peptide/nickel transport system permease protein
VHKRWYLLKKLSQSLLTVAIVLIMNFFLFRIMPGDPLRILIRNPKIPPEALARIREQFGLDRALHTQFLFFIRDLFQGDLGVSFNYRRPVLEVIMERVPATLVLVGTATLLSIVLGVLIGVISAWRRGTPADVAGLSVSLIFYAMPTFWFAILMVMFFSVYLRAFPTGGMGVPGAVYASLWAELAAKGRYLFLPATTFGLILAGEYALIMRNSLLEVLSEDYMTTARAKGVKSGDLLKKHAIPNAMLPMVTLIAINLGFIIAGAIQVETVFSWPGLGRLMYSALMTRDYPLLQGLFLIITISVIGANFCADILYGYLDPRVKG